MKEKPIPEPLYGCVICYEYYSWPAEDLFWSDALNEWCCDNCWDDVDAHWTSDNGQIDRGISLAEELNMPTKVNCQHFKHGGYCTHHAAPRKLFGLPGCVLMHPPSDPRLSGCRLVRPHAKPDGYPPQPPSRTQDDCSLQTYAVTPFIKPDQPWPRA